jgi:5'-nucleotidase
VASARETRFDLEMPVVERPLILLSNDDGVHAEGIHKLRLAVAEIADVIVVAPASEQSATSHRITLHQPLRHRDLGHGVHMVDGTPADCIYVALNLGELLPRRPALVVSGINHGLNMGMDVVYSGTVAAAREGALRGIPAMAISAEAGADFGLVAAQSIPLIQRLLDGPRPQGMPPLLNVNFPKHAPKGVLSTRLGRRDYEDRVDIRLDPRGRSYYWIGGPGVVHDGAEGADTTAVDTGYVSVTPLSLEMTQSAHAGLVAWVVGQTEPNQEETK